MSAPPESDAELAPAPRTPDPFTLVVFGASGDLARRKLLPAVYRLFGEGLLPERFAILGTGRTEMADDEFRGKMREAVETYGADAGGATEAWDRFAGRLHYQTGGYDDPESYRMLRDRLAELSEGDEAGSALFYLAVPPEVFVSVVEGLRGASLARPGQGDEAPWSRVVVEKPFGRDIESARRLNAILRDAFEESQVFRIDHYLGKETVQNLMALRFANAIFEPLWDHTHVDHVQITVAETVGMEGRGAYYDGAGALRDIVQNHMMHLVALTAMGPPIALDAQAVRDEKVKVLRALRPVACDGATGSLVRGRYRAGLVSGERVPGYLEEEGVAEDSTTETYAAMKLYVDNWRWSGVPFYVRTGKRMPVRITEIGIHFRPIPQVLFGAGAKEVEPNVLAIRIQPNEGVNLRFQVKVPGPAMRVEPFQMDFAYAEAFDREPPEAYVRLLLDAALGDATLFTRADEAETAWAFLDPILEACAEAGDAPEPYDAGSWGPAAADRLLAAAGRRWTLVRRPHRT